MRLVYYTSVDINPLIPLHVLRFVLDFFVQFVRRQVLCCAAVSKILTEIASRGLSTVAQLLVGVYSRVVRGIECNGCLWQAICIT